MKLWNITNFVKFLSRLVEFKILANWGMVHYRTKKHPRYGLGYMQSHDARLCCACRYRYICFHSRHCRYLICRGFNRTVHSFIHSVLEFFVSVLGSSTRAKLLQSIVKRRRDFKNDVFFVRLFKVESLVILLIENVLCGNAYSFGQKFKMGTWFERWLRMQAYSYSLWTTQTN
jgi:uncharacterized protein YlbG (UPF0298 family)